MAGLRGDLAEVHRDARRIQWRGDRGQHARSLPCGGDGHTPLPAFIGGQSLPPHMGVVCVRAGWWRLAGGGWRVGVG